MDLMEDERFNTMKARVVNREVQRHRRKTLICIRMALS